MADQDHLWESDSQKLTCKNFFVGVLCRRHFLFPLFLGFSDRFVFRQRQIMLFLHVRTNSLDLRSRKGHEM